MKPTRIQLSRAKGWRMPANTVKVDRTTKWGNPFRVHNKGPDCGAVEYAVRRFTMMVSGYYCLCATPSVADQQGYVATMLRDIPELAGKNLACWCALDKPCHADTLLKAARVYATKRGTRTRERYLEGHTSDGRAVPRRNSLSMRASDG